MALTLKTLHGLLRSFKVKIHQLAPSIRLPDAIVNTIRRYVLEEAELITAEFHKLWGSEVHFESTLFKASLRSYLRSDLTS